MLHYRIYHIWRSQNETRMLWLIHVGLCLEFNLISTQFFSHACYLFQQETEFRASESSTDLKLWLLISSVSFAYSSLCKWELIICVFSCRAVILLRGGVVRAAAPAHSLHGNLDFLDWAGPCSLLSYHRDPWAASTDGVSKSNLKYSDLLLRLIK